MALFAGAASLIPAFLPRRRAARSNSSRSLNSVSGSVREHLPDRLLFRPRPRPLSFAPALPFFLLRPALWNASLLFEPRDALRTGLEVQPQRPLDGDLAVAEMRRREDLADDDLFLPRRPS